MTLEQQQAYATEWFWEYIRGNVSALVACQACAALEVTTTPAQMNVARMRDTACGAWSATHNRAFEMRQP